MPPLRVQRRSRGAVPGGVPRRATPSEGLLLQLDELLQHLVGGGDDAGVRLEAALGDDQVGELLR